VIHLATAIDARYVAPLQVALASLLEHLDGATTVTLHVLHRSLGREERAVLSRLVETRFHVPPPELVARIPPHPRYPAEVAFPLLIGDVLGADVSRVLFLDADLLVLDDVARLWGVDLDGRVVGAVEDGAVAGCAARRGVEGWRTLGIPADQRYFNCGVLLVDLDAWRAQRVADRALARLGAATVRAPLYHQEALNAVLWDAWRPLDARWNRLAAIAGRRHDTAVARPLRTGIVHFAGRLKPWLMPVGGPFEAPYRRQLAALGLTRPAPSLHRRLLSAYDRLLRDLAYPAETALWERGWI
jgi:lipopolysaccharide biosynthesis glycosyltransferase